MNFSFERFDTDPQKTKQIAESGFVSLDADKFSHPLVGLEIQFRIFAFIRFAELENERILLIAYLVHDTP